MKRWLWLWFRKLSGLPFWLGYEILLEVRRLKDNRSWHISPVYDAVSIVDRISKKFNIHERVVWAAYTRARFAGWIEQLPIDNTIPSKTRTIEFKLTGLGIMVSELGWWDFMWMIVVKEHPFLSAVGGLALTLLSLNMIGWIKSTVLVLF